jgi:hypothetical protein
MEEVRVWEVSFCGITGLAVGTPRRLGGNLGFGICLFGMDGVWGLGDVFAGVYDH